MPSSAGILVFRKNGRNFEFLLAHPGGPYFQKKDEGHWTIPKGLLEKGEDELKTAIREFREETNYELTETGFIELPRVRYKNGKNLCSWAIEKDLGDLRYFKSNLFEIEWPPRTHQIQSFPEIDKLEYFPYTVAVKKIHPVQIPLIEFIYEQMNK